MNSVESGLQARKLSNHSDRPLDGIRVIDFGQYIAGPLAAMLLADQGAEVIRVEPPGGPFYNTPANAVFNRGKQRIHLDLKSRDDLKIARDLIGTADVVIENFRPNVMARLGLGAEGMCGRNPRLIYLSLPGFSAADREMASVQAWEGVIAAATGLYTDISLTREFRRDPPVYTALPMASLYAAVHGVSAVVLALLAREDDGRGDVIEVPLASAVISGLSAIVTEIEDKPKRYGDPTFQEMDRSSFSAGDDLAKVLAEYGNPLYTNYRCADNRLYFVCSDAHRKISEAALRTLGLWEELVRAGLPMDDPFRPVTEWEDGANLFSSNGLPLTWRQRIRTKMADAFRAHPGKVWESRFGKAGAAGAVQQTTEEWIRSEHALASGLVVEVEDGQYGPMKQFGPQVWFPDGEKPPAPSPVRDLNGGDLEALISMTHDKSSVEEGTTSGNAPRRILEGIRVLDLCNVLAGPTTGAQLARFGADVIKIDSPSPCFDPFCTIYYALDIGRGKRSMLLDLKTEMGQKAFERLLKRTDIVVYNGTNAGLHRLGLDPQRLHKLNSELILVQISAFGGPGSGPMTNYVGYDDTTQAATGIMARFGTLDDPEEHCNASTVDSLTGFTGVFASALALFRRRRLKKGAHVATSLAAVAQLAQSPYFYDFDGREPWNEPNGRRAVGENALYRIYETADEWLFLGARPSQLNHLAEALEQPAIAAAGSDLGDEELNRILEHRLRQLPASDWIKRLRPVGIGAEAVQTLKQVRETHLAVDGIDEIDLNGESILLIRYPSHPSGRWVDLIAPNWIRMKNSLINETAPASKFGRHTRAVLEEHGYAPAEIEELISSGVAAESWSNTDEYLPG